jgi:hypothetical protein
MIDLSFLQVPHDRDSQKREGRLRRPSLVDSSYPSTFLYEATFRLSLAKRIFLLEVRGVDGKID